MNTQAPVVPARRVSCTVVCALPCWSVSMVPTATPGTPGPQSRALGRGVWISPTVWWVLGGAYPRLTWAATVFPVALIRARPCAFPTAGTYVLALWSHNLNTPANGTRTGPADGAAATDPPVRSPRRSRPPPPSGRAYSSDFSARCGATSRVAIPPTRPWSARPGGGSAASVEVPSSGFELGLLMFPGCPGSCTFKPVVGLATPMNQRPASATCISDGRILRPVTLV